MSDEPKAGKELGAPLTRPHAEPAPCVDCGAAVTDGVRDGYGNPVCPRCMHIRFERAYD